MSYTGKELEEIVLYRCREIDEPARRYTLGRYGVMAVLIDGKWQPITSLPDMEGALYGTGRQLIFECKVCSQASYALSGGTSKSFKNQYKHLQRRSKFGVLTFILLHFNERKLKGKVDPEFTVMFPVQDNQFWQAYDRGEEKAITRAQAKMYGIEVAWDIPPGRQISSPNIYEGLLKLRALIDAPQITLS